MSAARVCHHTHKVGKYEIGMAQVPARFIPIITHILKVDITDLLRQLTGRPAEIQT